MSLPNKSQQEIQLYSIQPQPRRASSILEFQTPLNLFEKLKFDSLSKLNIWCYGVGHMLNDISAITLMNYMPFFLKNVNPIDEKSPGYWVGTCILIGQVVDGLCTPCFGMISDKIKTRFGRRKPWHFCGSILTFAAFLLLFQECRLCSLFPDSSAKIINYTLLFCLYNIGWAASQVSHMSLIPSLSVSRSKRDQLNGLRNTFMFIANFLALIVALFAFSFIENPITQFMIIGFITGVLGFSCCIVFWIGVPEVQLTNACIKYAKKIKRIMQNILAFVELDENKEIPKNKSVAYELMIEEEYKEKHKENKTEIVKEIKHIHSPQKKNEENPENIEYDYDPFQRKLSLNYSSLSENDNTFLDDTNFHWYSWFSMRIFYQYGLIYILVRVSNGVIQTVIIFYLLNTLQLNNHSIEISNEMNKEINRVPFEVALIPLIIYSFSCLGSFYCQKLYEKLGRKVTYYIGAFICLCSSILLFLITKDYFYFIYPTSIFIGIGQSLCLNTGASMIADVIGLHSSKGAFVYGIYGFFDKSINGLVIFFLMENPLFENNDPDFIRYIIANIPMASVLLACLLVYFAKHGDYKGKEQNLKGRMHLLQDFAE